MEIHSHQQEPNAGANPVKKGGDEEVEHTLVTKKPGSKAQGRKRTKSGCLTCRRRRIKCGEEKPTCQNCTKSKRQCEGYNLRVVFKDPLNTYRGPPIPSHVQFTDPVPPTHQKDMFQQPFAVGGPLPIAPKPSGKVAGAMKPTEVTHPHSVTNSGVEPRAYAFKTNVGPHPTTAASQNFRPLQRTDIAVDTVDHSRLPEPSYNRSPRDVATHYDFDALEPVNHDSKGQTSTASKTSPLEWSAGPSSASHPSSQELFYDSNSPYPAPNTFYQSYPSSSDWKPHTTSSTPSAPSLTATRNNSIYTPQPDIAVPTSGVSMAYGDRQGYIYHEQTEPLNAGDSWKWEQHTASQIPEHIYAEDEDPLDPYDISDGDEDMEDPNGNGAGFRDDHLITNDLGVVVALQARQDTRNLAIRTITAFIDRPDMLATYVPSPQASPLQDPMSARIFCHFINVTGPTISMFERHPANPSLIFQGRPIPRSMQHIWTYTFPTLALHNQGLLHAMLALASLHIAKLQNGPITASLRHYAYSLRKIAKSVSLPHRRKNSATLAATMLLAFYEVWCADHQKWTNHLLGAKMLVREIDFAGITKHIKSLRLQQHQEERAMEFQAQQQGYHPMRRNQLTGAGDEVDENIVSMLMGKKLRYDSYGRIIDDSPPDVGGAKVYTEKDIATYETQQDLFWWYCKNDAYQSMLGGGRLFMDYNRWSHCPPRAPLGRLNATYGTFDHLILLMGRLADFTSRDVKRKRLQMKANGGYRPPGMPPQVPRPQGPPQSSPPAQPQMPPFSGMMPDMGEAKLPMGFEGQGQSPPNSQGAPSPGDDVDLDALRIEAEAEWQEIRHAFVVLEDHFGEEFQALGPEYSIPIETPFGLARQYRTYGIAGIWLNYYAGLIACHRAHPSMPPAAMMASGIAARHTDTFANEIGRISAGIAPDCNMTAEVSPGVGAALIESSTPLFIGSVQYQNAAQRHWTVNRLRDIARLTGFQTAHAVCTGIETSWTKAAEMGRGPPYTRMSDTYPDRIIPDIWPAARRRLDFAMAGSNEERRLVIRQTDRAHYALGVLGLESDFDNVELENNRGA